MDLEEDVSEKTKLSTKDPNKTEDDDDSEDSEDSEDEMEPTLPSKRWSALPSTVDLLLEPYKYKGEMDVPIDPLNLVELLKNKASDSADESDDGDDEPEVITTDLDRLASPTGVNDNLTSSKTQGLSHQIRTCTSSSRSVPQRHWHGGTNHCYIKMTMRQSREGLTTRTRITWIFYKISDYFKWRCI